MGSGQSDGGVFFYGALSRNFPDKERPFLRPPQVYLYGLHLGASFFPVKKSVRNLTGMEALHVTLMCNGLPPFNNGNAWVFYNERNTSW